MSTVSLGRTSLNCLSFRGVLPKASFHIRASPDQLQVDPGDCKAVRNDAVSGVQLPTMDEDEPAWLSFVIARYLDEERLPGMVNLC